MENEEKKVGVIGKFKQADEGVKLAVAVGVGLTVGVAGTLALQAYGKKRETDALRLQSPVTNTDTPRITVLRVPSMQQ